MWENTEREETADLEFMSDVGSVDGTKADELCDGGLDGIPIELDVNGVGGAEWEISIEGACDVEEGGSGERRSIHFSGVDTLDEGAPAAISPLVTWSTERPTAEGDLLSEVISRGDNGKDVVEVVALVEPVWKLCALLLYTPEKVVLIDREQVSVFQEFCS